MSKFLTFLLILTLLGASLPASTVYSTSGSQTGDQALAWYLTGSNFNAQLGESSTQTGLFIILLTDPPLSRYRGGILGLAPTDPEVTGVLRLDPDSPASVAYLNYLNQQQDSFIATMQASLGRQVEVVFRYDAVLNGLAVRLTPQEAVSVASLSGVARVAPDEERFLLTDAGPAWIGAPAIWEGEATGGLEGTSGAGIVAGVIDTGVNHDHPSFAEVGPVDGHVHENPKGRFFGACDPALGVPFCNNKLIGFYDFTGTTPEDTNGHGSHTASTTAGNVLDADLVAPTITISRQISGVAPHANIISYKVCITTCPLTSILAAINQATLDVVDVINYSIGGSANDPWQDLDALAFLNARNAGIFVATSAGNSGPGEGTIGSPADAPWVFTVGASTHDRKFSNNLANMSGGASAPPVDIEGKSVTSGYGPALIVYAGDFGDPLCQTPFLPGTWTNGEIVVCDRGVNPRVEKAENVAAGGAGGFVLANEAETGDSTVADPYVIPGVNITHRDGQVLKAWLADGGSGHTATISGTLLDKAPIHGDIMAGFSSRGPNPSVADVLKPDITAPGVDVLAALNTVNPLAPTEFGVLSGTSMSSPHAAGAAALLRSLRPEWTPDQVKSALMTTAFTSLPGRSGEVHDVLKEDGATPADPFDVGGGRVDLMQAGKAGLVLDVSTSNYESANPGVGGDPKTLNLASLADGNCVSTCSWLRSVENVTGQSMSWSAAVSAPPGLAVSVSPNAFSLAAGESQTITVTANVDALDSDGWRFARVVLIPQENKINIPETHLPVAVNRSGGGVQVVTLHFHGNVHDGCTGLGPVDLDACGGPFLLEDPDLDPDNQAAAWGPVTTRFNCTVPRCEVDPNWIWNLDGPTTLQGPMTVAWWVSCPACDLLFFDDFFIRLWAEDVLVFEERVRHNIQVPAEPIRLSNTLLLPELTASNNFVLHIDPIFVNQDGSIFYYDSTQACPGGSHAPCDSLVRMPVVSMVQPVEAEAVGGGWLETIEGKKINFNFNVETTADEIGGQLQLNDKVGNAKVNLTQVTFVGEVSGDCGSISSGQNALEIRGTGSFNGADANFRACFQDNGTPGHSRASDNPDLFYLECATGCSYDTASRTPDDAIDGGNISVARTSDGENGASGSSQPSATTMMLDPLLLTEGLVGQLQLFTVTVYDQNQQVLPNAAVTLTRTTADGSVDQLTALTSLAGTATFTMINLNQVSEYIATAGSAESNAIETDPILN